MKDPWLVFDAPYLAHRSFRAMGVLSYEGIDTSVAFGFFRDLFQARDRFESSRFVFCFDGPGLLRKQVEPTYKTKRGKAKMSAELVDSLSRIKRQIDLLRTQYLPEAGFTNVFYKEGYEADDLIASVTGNLPKGDSAVVVAADEDLLQLLSKRVRIWNPRTKSILTSELFVEEHGIRPYKWAEVKAIAGCTSDCLAGVKGVGEKTALKYLRKELSPDSSLYKRIRASGEIISRNRPLVTLPYEGCPVFSLGEDRVTRGKWVVLADRLGLKSLRDKI